MKMIGNFSAKAPKHICMDEWSVPPMSRRQEIIAEKIVRAYLRSKSALLHGSMSGSKILRTNTMLQSEWENEAISFTRDVGVATQWANCAGIDHDTFGTIFVVNPTSLKCLYKVEPFNDLDWKPHGPSVKFEMEERVRFRDISHLDKYVDEVIFVAWGFICATSGWNEARNFSILLKSILRFLCRRDEHQLLPDILYRIEVLPAPIRSHLHSMVALSKADWNGRLRYVA